MAVFGWGVVAPKSPNIDRFAQNLETPESWLTPFNGFGPDNFLVGNPEFDFSSYSGWISERFAPSRFRQIDEKMDMSTKYAIGSFVQSLSQNPEIEQILKDLGTEAHVYVGTGLAALPTHSRETLRLYRAQRAWNRFWAEPARNKALRGYLELSDEEKRTLVDVPPHPDTASPETLDETQDSWWDYWMERSAEIQNYLAEYKTIEETRVEGDVEKAKLRVIREKTRLHAKLLETWGAPPPPWTQVSADVIWNIANTPASQISMMGRITGLSFAPVAACSTFGVALKLGMDAIKSGEAKAVVVGATDPPPHPLLVGAFNQGRVIAGDGAVSKPLTHLRGTHVAGGSVVWILGDHEYMTSRGLRPVGMEPLSVTATADAHHIITPTKEGPTKAIQAALAAAAIRPEEVDSWDLHATATPGDYLEVETLRDNIPGQVLVTARKGTFGHGMSAGGGWELTAQYLGFERGKLFPTVLEAGELNPEIAKLHDGFVFNCANEKIGRVAGKLSMGIGGINACIISRAHDG